MYQEIPFSSLIVSPDNVRTVSPAKAADKQLIAGIRAEGLLQNLVVRPLKKNGRYEVIAGGRRYAAIAYLIKDGSFPKDYLVDCKVKTEGSSVSASLAENLQRASMHPADEFDAFNALIKEGFTERELSEHYSVPLKHVRQRLKLADVSPFLVSQYRKNKLTLDDLMAFTVTDDQEKQLACWKDISRSHFGPHSIRRWLTGTAETTRSAVVRFVGASAYKKAGGEVSADLFESETYFMDRGLLLELAETRLNQAAEALGPEGWKWVSISHDGEGAAHAFLQLQPVAVDVPDELEAEIKALSADLQGIEDEADKTEWTEDLEARYDATDEALDQAEAQRADYHRYRDEDKAQAGCVVTYAHSGELVVLRGLLRKEDAKKVRAQAGTGASPDDADAAPTQPIPQALSDDLTAYRQQIVKAALAGNAAVASDVLLYSLCSQLIDGPGWRQDRLLDARFDAVESVSSLDDVKDMSATQALAERRNSLNTGWLSIEDTAQRFAALRALSAKEKKALLAFCVAASLTVSLSNTHTASGAGEQLVNDLGIDFPKQWRPTGDNYFKRLRIPTLLDLGLDWFGGDWQEKHAKAKKSALVAVHHAFINGPVENIEGDATDVRETWLPAGFLPNPAVDSSH